jgi:hypothetical protein
VRTVGDWAKGFWSPEVQQLALSNQHLATADEYPPKKAELTADC